ncbi:penicillin-binding protein 2 [Patescibacteria group bacterium]|nr:penicillin-binding protein 2 [Patescibacteria group bacterium]
MEGKFKYLTIAVLLLCGIVLIRLYHLQIVKGNYYRFFSEENSIKELPIPSPRGEILDRRGNVLVSNRASFDIILIPQYVKDPAKAMDSLHTLLNIDMDDLKKVWASRDKFPSYAPLVVRRDASLSDVAIIRSRKGPWLTDRHGYDLRGVDVVVNYVRRYPQGNMATHLLGYLREVDAGRLKHLNEKYPGRYESGDVIGIRGVEALYDNVLRGEDGYDQYVVNAVGQRIDYEGIADRLKRVEARSGHEISLTVDVELQKMASELLKDYAGAAVMVDVNTGAILLWYSSPSYDLTEMAGPDGSKYWSMLSQDKDKALLDRVVQGAYPPASTFKIVTGLAGLESGKINENTRQSCGGVMMFGNRGFHCWNKYGHGSIDFNTSLVQSCDIYYYLTGLKVGVDGIVDVATKLGMGKSYDLGLTDERSGVMPTLAWQKKNLKRGWQKGDTVSFSVGQGYNTVTPLQNSMMLAQIVNGGVKLAPHFVNTITDVEGKVIYTWKMDEKTEMIGLSKKNLMLIKKALSEVVSSPSGTGHRLSRLAYPMGGKTGTAQVVSLDRECHSKECRDHGWFVGFAPTDKPQVAVAVISEHSGFGATVSAPTAGALLELYLKIEDEVKKGEKK